jgi:hypothetical protein
LFSGKRVFCHLGALGKTFEHEDEPEHEHDYMGETPRAISFSKSC